MAGIYIHIPFCRKACNYCNFHFSTSLRNKRELIFSILTELNQRKNYLRGDIINTIYFGGGTPSLLDIKDIDIILNAISKNYKLNKDIEITLEANPDDLSIQKLKSLYNSGVNRLSIGVQSFEEEELHYLERTHSARQAISSIELCKEAGIENISIDLIYGIPVSDNNSWNKNLILLNKFKIPHFSAYALTIEEKTILNYQIIKKKREKTSDEKIRSQFFMLTEFASNYGYDHYEISNFCKKGFMSKHNSSYWKMEKYLGVGPSSHSYDIESRQWNIAVNEKYIKLIKDGENFYTREILSEKDQFNELIMISLRTKWGLDLESLNKKYFDMIPDSFSDSIENLVDKKLATIQDKVFRLTKEGLILSDNIISGLIL